MTSACFSRGHTGFSRNATLVATVNPPALAGGVFKSKCDSYDIKYHKKGTGFVFPGILYYSVKNYDEKINTAKIKDKKQKEKRKEKQLQEQYDKLKL